jgi:hypothetical protein
MSSSLRRLWSSPVDKCPYCLLIQSCPLNLSIRFLAEAVGPLANRRKDALYRLLILSKNFDQMVFIAASIFSWHALIVALIFHWLAFMAVFSSSWPVLMASSICSWPVHMAVLILTFISSWLALMAVLISALIISWRAFISCMGGQQMFLVLPPMISCHVSAICNSLSCPPV